jgi:hypothetical protein
MWEARSVAPIRSPPLKSSARWNAPPTLKMEGINFRWVPSRGGVAEGRGGSSPAELGTDNLTPISAFHRAGSDGWHCNDLS